MNTCSFDLQKQIIKVLLFSGAKDITSINGAIKRVDPNYDVNKCLSDFDESGKRAISTYLLKFGIDPNKLNFNKNILQSKPKVTSKAVNNISTSNFQSSEVTDLFFSMNVAKNFFELETKRLLTEAVYIGSEENKKYVKDDKEININLKSLKNKLFKDLVIYLHSKNLLNNKELFFNEKNEFIGNLYERNGKFKNYNLYKQIINKLDEEFFKDSEKKSYTGRLLPKIESNIIKPQSRELLKVYNSAVLLVNFDNVLTKYFSNIVDLDYLKFNSFIDDDNKKYKLRTKGFETPYWLQDNHESEGANNLEDDLTKNLVSIIPLVNKYGEETPYYMETKDLYSLASLIRNFETKYFNKLIKSSDENLKGWTSYSENPEVMFDWYLNNILNAFENGFTNEYSIFSDFKYKIDIIKSLNLFKERLKEKEKNSNNSIISLLRQVLNNSYGAVYSVYNVNTGKYESIEMFSHNSNRIALQNTIYSHFDRNSENEEKFKIPNNHNSLKEIVNSPKLLNKYILNLLGIHIGDLGSERLIKLLTLKNSKNPEIELISLIKLIHSSNVIEKVSENEKIKQDLDRKGETLTQSEVISEFLKSGLVNDILDIALDVFPIKPIMNISKQDGEKIPTFKLATLTYSDTDLIKTHYDNRSDEDKFESLFIEGNQSVLLGTGTKLEVINKDRSKDISKLSEKESFKSDFFYDFLGNLIQKDTNEIKGVNIMIGNYSDKSTILTKIINSSVAINSDSEENKKYIIGNEDSSKVMSVEEVIELTRVQSFSFYSDMFNEIFNQYNILFTGLNLLSLSGTFDEKVTRINNYLQSKSKKELLSDQKKVWTINNNLGLSEEIHYSSYSNGLALNQQLVNFYRLTSSSDNFNLFVKSQENSFSNKLIKQTGDNMLFDFDELSSEIIEGDLSKLDEYKKLSKFLGVGELTRKSIVNKKGELHPMLRKWMWVNALFRNEYLFISTKGEYNHPHKVRGLQFNDNFSIKNGIYYINDVPISENISFKKEMSGRLSSMAKRNVAFTATIEKPIKKSKYGVTDKVNLATIQDFTGEVYNYSGKLKDDQDIHDGSSMINYLHSKMIEASYPGKSYRGTKKQFATFITKFGSSVKKDAETVITNDKIRNSKNSNISYLNKQKQMLSSHDIYINNEISITLNNNNIFWKDGEYYKINEYSLSGNVIKLKIDKRSANGGWIPLDVQEGKFNNLYDLWIYFGAEYSVDSNLKFNEGSNETLYDLITRYSENNEYVLKDKMIHIISNHSAIKSGATRLNGKNSWLDDSKLMYSSFDNKYMGPQLDANHDSDGSEVKEVSQVLSALAQNGFTGELAEDVYNSLAQIIKTSAEPYVKKISSEELTDLSKLLSKKFFDSVTKSDNVSLAKSILETFDEGKIIPFSNQNFFQLFVRDVISRMNNEFISRYYSGIAAILNPSHNMIQVYEDVNGNVYSQEDISYEAIENYDKSLNLTSDQIINNYINTKFKSVSVLAEEINPGDTVKVKEIIKDYQTHAITGQSIELEEEVYIDYTLDTIEKYYEFKEKNKGKLIEKVYNKPRDLKPSEITFKINNTSFNLFDTDSIRLRYKLSKLKDIYKNLEKNYQGVDLSNQIEEVINSSDDFIILSKLAKFNNIGYLDFNNIEKVLNSWTQRNLQLLDLGKIMIPVTKETNFEEYFGNDNIIKDVFEDVKNHYLTNNSISITNYKFKPAELILPNIYKSNFDTKSDSISKISKEGSNYFKNQLNKSFEEDDFKADLKIILKEGNNPVYVRYSTSIPVVSTDNLFRSEYETINGELTEVTYRLNSKGEKLYVVPKYSVVTVENGNDVIYIKAADKKYINIDGKDNSKDSAYILNNDFSKRINDLLRSFNGEISSIVPLMNENRPKIYESTTIKEDGETFYINKSYDLNEFTANLFNKHSGYNSELSGEFNKEWFKLNKEKIIDKLSKKMYSSWEKSREFVAARIPAQSMQSFMEMKNISYLNTSSNDAYVSVWQIWLQGSDFR